MTTTAIKTALEEACEDGSIMEWTFARVLIASHVHREMQGAPRTRAALSRAPIAPLVVDALVGVDR